MSLLVDTHVFVWWVTDDANLTAAHRRWIEQRDEPVFVSAVTGWEIAIKVKINKWPEAAALLPDLRALVRRSGLQSLDISLAQAERAGCLDLFHRDPFDRLLAAQALDLSIPVATIDPVFARFGCQVI